MPRIVHIALANRFLGPFVEFVNANFPPADHAFLIAPAGEHAVPHAPNVVDLTGRTYRELALRWTLAMHRADLVILHGLFDRRLLRVLALQPWLGAKCHWVIWGGDLYQHEFRERSPESDRYERTLGRVVSRLGGLVTHIRGDYELARQWYGARGAWLECFVYPSNLFRAGPALQRAGPNVNILVGNSGDPTNDHAEVFRKLLPHREEAVRIHAPLSYGDSAYIRDTIALGKSLFGDKFNALTAPLPFEDYLRFLSGMDVAVFNHRRQQALGNLTALLGMGKKVYLRSDVTTWETLAGMGLSMFDVSKFDVIDISGLPADAAARNAGITRERFSEARLKSGLLTMFGG